jgi:DNA-binding transcriptional ArsR family regulator
MVGLDADDETIDVICADSPRDVQRLKLIAEELDNDTGRAVYLAFYSDLETVSQVTEKLGLTIQLVSYHVEKLVLAGLLREKKDSVWFSVKGKNVKHYEPSKAAILILPSLQYLKKNREVALTTRTSLMKAVRRFLPELFLPVLVFLGVYFSPKIVSSARPILTYISGFGTRLHPTTTIGRLIQSNITTTSPLREPTSSTQSTVISNLSSLQAVIASLAPKHNSWISPGLLTIATILAFTVWLILRFYRKK